MRYPFAHRTRRIVFLIALFPTATLAYIALPRGDVGLPAEHARSRTQDIAIVTRAPVVRGQFMEVPQAYVSHGVGARTAADEAAITELALTAGVTPLDSAARLAQRETQASRSAATVDTTTGRSPERSRRSGASSRTGFASSGMAGVGSFGGVSGAGRTRDAAATSVTAAPSEATSTTSTATLTTAASSTTTLAATTTRTAAPATTTTTEAPSVVTRAATGGTAAPSAVAAGGQTAIANTEDTPAAATVAAVFSTQATTPPGGQNNGSSQGGSPLASPSPTPEPITLLLMAGGLAAFYGARRHVG